MLTRESLEALSRGQLDTKFKVGKYYEPITIKISESMGTKWFHLKFGFNRNLINIIKEQFSGRRWDPDNKLWKAPVNQRNLFRISHLQGKYGGKPYAKYDAVDDKVTIEQVKEYALSRGITLFQHQAEMAWNMVNSGSFIAGAKMGLGKTLSAIIAIEMFMEMNGTKEGHILWFGPKSALAAAHLEFKKWRARFTPEFGTYQKMVKVVREWESGRRAPQIVCFDEASRLKSPDSQRTQCAIHLCDSMRVDWQYNCMILQLSGTPAPNSPDDWWSLCEVAAPGFLTEGHKKVLRNRLGFFEQRETLTGVGFYPHLLGWKDGSALCKWCGQSEAHPNHDPKLRVLGQVPTHEPHDFEQVDNEVAKLHTRMKGLVDCWFKEDCLDLPPKRYKVFNVDPLPDVLNAARVAVANTTRTVDALGKLRTLSDGFLYVDTPTGEKYTCSGCNGEGTVFEYFDENDPDSLLSYEEIEAQERITYDDVPDDDDPDIYETVVIDRKPFKMGHRSVECSSCLGKGELDKMERTLNEVTCPKDDVLRMLLDQHEEDGRFVVYCGFQGSLDRVCKICVQHGWQVIQADGRGWKFHEKQGTTSAKAEEVLELFQEGDKSTPIVFVGQPGAAGMGITLTASMGVFFYSNDFNAENREQSEERTHRMGMDDRGGWVYDVIHLPTDERVLQALLRKQDLQRMSMKGFADDYR